MLLAIPTMIAWAPFMLGNSVLTWWRAQPAFAALAPKRKLGTVIALASLVMLLPTLLKLFLGGR
jgi:hypothetical protein